MLRRLRPGWWLLGPGVVGALLSPMLLTGRTYDVDWFNHLWLVWNQQHALEATGHPTLWTHTDHLGAFYGQFVFYGGSLYAVVGALAVVVHSAVWAYVASYGAGLAAAYGGWAWLARQAGLTGWRAHVPGALHVTSAYVLSLAYARGAWPELMATSALPLLVAAGLALWRAESVRLGPAAAFVGAVALFSGSHNITLAWGTVFLAGLALVGAWAHGRAGRPVAGTARRVVRVGALAALGVALNAWFLLADVRFGGRLAADAYSTGAPEFNRLSIVLAPWRAVPAASSTRDLYVQLPVVALLWALAAIALSGVWRRRGAPRRLGLGLVVLLLGFLVLLTRDDPLLRHLGAPGTGLWRHLPHPLQYVQFAYRLEAYATMLVCALVLLGLVALTQARPATRRGLELAVAAIAVVSLGVGVWQAWSAPSALHRGRATLYEGSVRTVPPGWQDAGNYLDRGARVVAARSRVRLSPADAADTRGIPVPSGRGPVATNVAAPAPLVDAGVRVLGRTARGDLVVAGGGTLRPRAAGLTLTLGRWVSPLALLVCLAGSTWLATGDRRRAATARPAGRRTAGR